MAKNNELDNILQCISALDLAMAELGRAHHILFKKVHDDTFEKERIMNVIIKAETQTTKAQAPLWKSHSLEAIISTTKE